MKTMSAPAMSLAVGMGENSPNAADGKSGCVIQR